VAGVRRRVALAGGRKVAGHTQESLAAVLHVDRSTVIRWEAGDQAPLPYLRPKLARLLGQSLEQLRELIKDDSDIQAEESGASPDIEAAFGWLDQHTGWSPGTSRRKVMSRLGNHNRNGQRINVGSG
jgi:DNA-binding XRE family transcriptional regulator